MMAAVWLGRRGFSVDLYEKNEKLGKKLYITGKGRCNLTNNTDEESLLASCVTNPKFLYSAFYSWNSQAVMQFFEEAGVPLKTERGNRVFPVSDHSSDIIRALERELSKTGVRVHLNEAVKEIRAEEGAVKGLVLQNGSFVPGDAVLVATGGRSYPSTGSTGDGYRFAFQLGHRVTDQRPSLVPLLTKESYIPELQGLSLKNVSLRLLEGSRTVFEDFGEMLFTHNGVSGPMILSASARAGKYLQDRELEARVDLKPALSEEQLDARILREFEAAPNRQLKNVIGVLFPGSMTPVIIRLSGVPGEKVIHDITREDRSALVSVIKGFPFTITGTGGFSEAVITRGGVSVKDVRPGTMESKVINGLYFAGEVLDVDAVTGGFNLQIAWSTAYLAALGMEEG